jgi:two-component system, LytTR family, response regulator
MSETNKIDRIAWPTENGYILSNRSSVHYCQAQGSYTNIYFDNGAKIVVSYKIKVVEYVLSGPPFFRTHESYICNLYHALQILRKDGAWHICLANAKLPVARARQKALLECFHTIHEAKMALYESKQEINEIMLFDHK